MTSVERSALVHHSARAMYELVADIEQYPAFLPWCSDARVVARSAEEVRATIQINFHGLRQRFTTCNLNRPYESITLKLVDGPFRRLDGVWTFQALGERASRVGLSMQYEFSGLLLDKVAGPVFGHIANTMVDAFVRRAGAPQGEGPA